ncbi:MAG TPA: hypothetical protein VLJ86_22810 [Ramlibacter sp.]|nr:hypothetical protein [Ramlibacter sp.]
MKATIAALLICLGCNAFAECVGPASSACVTTPSAAALVADAAIIKTGTTRADAASLRATPGVARRSNLVDVPPHAQAQPGVAETGERPAHGWSESGLLLAGVALMAGIALRRYGAGPR